MCVTFDTFDGQTVPPSGLNLRKEEPGRDTLRPSGERRDLVKDCFLTVLRKEVKEEDNPVPNKTPPFNTREEKEDSPGLNRAILVVSERLKVLKVPF